LWFLTPDESGPTIPFADLVKQQVQEGLCVTMVYGKEVYVVRFDGRPAAELKLDVSLYFHGGRFTPDGKRIIGSTNRGLAMIDLAGRTVWLNERIGPGAEVAVSPDGSAVAVAGEDRATRFKGIQVLRADTGGDPHEIARDARDPSWSPDASTLAYEVGGKIVLRDLRSSSIQTLIAGTQPAWSPDGKWIAYRSDGSVFRLLQPRQKNVIPLFKSRKILTPLRWSPDSEYLLYVQEGKSGFLGLGCLEPKDVVVRRLRDSHTAKIHRVCKSSPYDFAWARNPQLASRLD